MKTGPSGAATAAPAIVQLLDPRGPGGDGVEPATLVARARAFTEPLVTDAVLDTREGVLAHAEGVAAILESIGASPALRAAAFLVHAADHLGKPDDVLAKAFGEPLATLVSHARRLTQVQRTAHAATRAAPDRVSQLERVRKMLLAFSRDLRVVLLRLASRLQTLRHFAASKQPCPHEIAAEALQVFAPLANRLGIWQVKWELEDLAFRFLEPLQYRRVAALIDEKRAEREQRVERLRRRLSDDLAVRGLVAQVQGRPKHIYSIWRKMALKHLDFERVFDVRALRVIVPDVATCYAVLGRVHELFAAVPGEFDDYIARPKPNGYQSLHTVVADEDGRAIEIQIRTHAMHEHAEHGISAHWAYKEAGSRAAAANDAFAARVAEARLVVLRQLLAWERDAARVEEGADVESPALFDDRIYVFTPQAAVVELTAGATPIDFAYAVHTELGHRCRGAKVDGAMVPLDTPLHSGQMVEITAAKTGGPSLDWLNPELGYLQSQRSRAKVRAWFNALAQSATIARGRDAVEKLLQREGKTALKLDELAARLGFRSADALFEVVGKDELSLRSIENLLHPPEPTPAADAPVALRRPRAPGRGGVLVVGVDSLLTTLARCCRPAPPDAVKGYVTKGSGVAVHRVGCRNFRDKAAQAPERVIDVEWGAREGAEPLVYAVDMLVEANDRQGLLRDISDVFAKEKMNVVAASTRSRRHAGAGAGTATMGFTIEVGDAARLPAVFALVAQVDGVRSVRRA